MIHKFKQGDRVKHIDDAIDEGTFMYYVGEDMVRVKWDEDGEMDNCLENIYLIEPNNKEQEAVMLLLSLGYTVSKGSK